MDRRGVGVRVRPRAGPETGSRRNQRPVESPLLRRRSPDAEGWRKVGGRRCREPADHHDARDREFRSSWKIEVGVYPTSFVIHRLVDAAIVLI